MNQALIFGNNQEEDINQMISDAGIYEENQGMERIPDDNPQKRTQSPEMKLPQPERFELYEKNEQYRQNSVRKRKHRRVRELLASLNRLSEELFAAIKVAELQMAVLQDLHSVFLISYRKKNGDNEKGYPLRQNSFHKNIAPIPILSENSEQIWPNALDTIGEVVRERKVFIKKIKGLVENMDIRRKIVQFLQARKYIARMLTARQLSAFLKSDQTDAVSERTADAIEDTKGILKKIGDQLTQQGHAVDGFTFMNIVFLPLNFCTSVFELLSVI